MHVITNKKEIEGITLKKFIEEKRLLKTKVKLLHILLLDEDIKDLSRECLTLTNLNLEDLLLTEEMHLIVPVKDKIILGEIDELKLRSYLIYLSYLYNIDFLSIYEQDKELLWDLISRLQISDNIKNNFYQLLTTRNGEFFSSYLEELNNPEYRSSLREDKLILQRSVKNSFYLLIVFIKYGNIIIGDDNVYWRKPNSY